MKRISILIAFIVMNISLFSQIVPIGPGGTWATARGVINNNFTLAAPLANPSFTGGITTPSVTIGIVTVTANGEELNILDGALVTAAELNKLIGIGTDTIATKAYARLVGGTGTGDLAFADTVSVTGFIETQFRIDTAKAAIRADIAAIEVGEASMVYPGAGIPLSTGSAWGTSITDNSSNWSTAYGWGNHASAGYVTGTPWTAMGYLTTETSHADVVLDGDFTSQGIMLRGASSGTYSILTNNSTAWNAAIAPTDTADMLEPYINKTDTSSMLRNYVNKADTSSMLTPYVNRADTAAMLSKYIRLSGGGSIRTVAVMLQPDTVQHTSNYTVGASDWGKDQHLNKATSLSVTLPPNLTEWPVGGVMNFYSMGAGITVFHAGSGVVFVSDTTSSVLCATERGKQDCSVKKIATSKYKITGPVYN